MESQEFDLSKVQLKVFLEQKRRYEELERQTLQAKTVLMTIGALLLDAHGLDPDTISAHVDERTGKLVVGQKE